MPDKELSIRVAALYRFTPFDDPAALKPRLEEAAARYGISGTLLLAREGINGTIAGADDAMDEMLTAIRALPGCAGIEVKDSRAATMPFGRMKVRLKREIVTMGEPDVDPIQGVGHYVAPEDWNAFVSQPGTILIDTRNDYEVGIGTFRGAVDPKTRSFREFPEWFRKRRDELAEAPRVAMFCTGGIRCEKSTAFLKAEGIEEVYHLEGGILKYLETVPAEESLWEGECFVFDERVSVGHGLELGTHVLCKPCGRPVSAEAQKSPLYVEGVSCPRCVEK
ncbi:MAG TPA: rhodanese-related sulfurtransferase [Allosphingosinicella sp.]